MGKPFSTEIDRLAATCDWAFQQQIEELQRLLSRWTDGPLIIVGSGGSFSAASAWASFHRNKYGQPSYAITPLSLHDVLQSLKQCRVLLLSAEGKNNDILNAAKLTKALDIPCAAITLTEDNLLTQFASSEKTLYTFAFSMNWGKDGYLATNTLLATVLLAARAYFNTSMPAVGPLLSSEYLLERRGILNAVPAMENIRHNGALVLHGSESALFAVDLESKLTEAALAKCEVADFRQFAHGRHLQLAQEHSRVPVAIFAFTAAEKPLAKAMMALFPSTVRCIEILVEGDTFAAKSVSALVEAFLVTEAAGQKAGIDPGRPDVPEFSRRIYLQDSSQYHSTVNLPGIIDIAVQRKINGAKALLEEYQFFEIAALEYAKKISANCFKALICDFDGTLCHAHERFSGMNKSVSQQLINLVEQGLHLGIATGRGGAIIKNLRQIFPESLWKKIWVGPYSGSIVKRLDDDGEIREANPDLYEALEWLKTSVLRRYGIEGESECKAGQVSLRVEDHLMASRIAFALHTWIAKTHRTGWRVFSSGHSVDLLDSTASKLNVVERLAEVLKIDPINGMLRIGDAGQPGGNDFELLRDSLSLSADKVSDSLSCCWNFSPPGVKQADATHYYLHSLSVTPAGARLKFPFIE